MGNELRDEDLIITSIWLKGDNGLRTQVVVPGFVTREDIEESDELKAFVQEHDRPPAEIQVEITCHLYRDYGDWSEIGKERMRSLTSPHKVLDWIEMGKHSFLTFDDEPSEFCIPIPPDFANDKRDTVMEQQQEAPGQPDSTDFEEPDMDLRM